MILGIFSCAYWPCLGEMFTEIFCLNIEFKEFFVYFGQKFFLIYFVREGKGGRKTGVETSKCRRLPLAHPQLQTWPETQACALTGNQTGNFLVSSRVLNPLNHTSLGTNFLSYISFAHIFSLSLMFLL